LHRVYAPVPADTDADTDTDDADDAPDSAAAARAIALLREMLADRDETIADLRTDRDHWRAQAERLLLAKPAAEATEVPAERPQRR
jgi:hypothetical protein